MTGIHLPRPKMTPVFRVRPWKFAHVSYEPVRTPDRTFFVFCFWPDFSLFDIFLGKFRTPWGQNVSVTKLENNVGQASEKTCRARAQSFRVHPLITARACWILCEKMRSLRRSYNIYLVLCRIDFWRIVSNLRRWDLRMCARNIVPQADLIRKTKSVFRLLRERLTIFLTVLKASVIGRDTAFPPVAPPLGP